MSELGRCAQGGDGSQETEPGTDEALENGRICIRVQQFSTTQRRE